MQGLLRQNRLCEPSIKEVNNSFEHDTSIEKYFMLTLEKKYEENMNDYVRKERRK